MERRFDTSRVRFRAIAEWAIASVFILTMVTAAVVVVRQFRTVSAVLPVMAREGPAAVPQTPAGVPSRAVSVPVLLLAGGRELRVGETFSAVDHLLGKDADAAPPSVERGPHGERVTRYYERGGTRFVLVFEPFEANAEPRVAAIYLQ